MPTSFDDCLINVKKHVFCYFIYLVRKSIKTLGIIYYYIIERKKTIAALLIDLILSNRLISSKSLKQ